MAALSHTGSLLHRVGRRKDPGDHELVQTGREAGPEGFEAPAGKVDG